MRPQFTIERKDGVNFDANHIFYSWKPEKGWFIFFICSGSIEEIPAHEIKEIRFLPFGAHYCGECDGTIPNRGE